MSGFTSRRVPVSKQAFENLFHILLAKIVPRIDYSRHIAVREFLRKEILNVYCLARGLRIAATSDCSHSASSVTPAH